MDWLSLDGALWLAWGAYWYWASRAVKANASAEPIPQRLAHLTPIAIGFALLFSRAPTFRPLEVRYLPTAAAPLGTLIVAAGLAFMVYARVHLGMYWSGRITLKEGHQLIRTGPYRTVRHPIYTGLLTGILGTAVTQGQVAGILALALVTAAYAIKIRREEAALKTQFGEEYERFQREVSALIPFVY